MDDMWSVFFNSAAMSVSANSQTADTQSKSQEVNNDSGLGKDAFMQLLLTQMQNQDPLSPMDGQDFFAQLAQFSLLEQMWTMNENLTAMQRQQQLLQASALIGRTVEYGGTDGSTHSGLVDGIHVLDGEVFVDIAGTQIPLGRVTAVSG